MKKTFLFLLLIGILFVSFKLINGKTKRKSTLVSQSNDANNPQLNAEISKVKNRFSSDTNYNSNIGFFINMRIPSMKNRFFVYDFKNDTIIDSGLVAHGSGSERGLTESLNLAI